MRAWLRNLTLASAGVTLLSLTMASHADLVYRRASLPPEEDLLYLPRPDVLRLASLGHAELTADLVWVRAVVYAGGEISQRGAMKWLDRYLDSIVMLDPTFKRPYKWAGVITMYNGRIITNEMVRQSSHYLELGEKHFPNDWELAFMLGCNYLHELKTDRPEQKASWVRTGAEHIRRAAILGGGPDWLPLLAATIFTRQGDTQLAIRHLEEVYATSEDPKVREQVRLRLLALRREDVQRQTSLIDEARKDLERRWRAWAPYAPVDLYILVGEPRRDQTLDELTAQPLLEEKASDLRPQTSGKAGSGPPED